MPPKGWRKNAEGAYPVTSKERDSISIEDILFPKATVNRLARAIIPDGGILSKDSSTVVQRSSTVFVNYLLIQ
jgi:DNA polymerase epsilon subunit 3